MKTIDVVFKNLKIGYYFLYENKAYIKINDFSAIQLFSHLEANLFTNVNSRFMNVNSKLEYERPSRVICVFDPNDKIEFLTKDELRQYLSDIFLETRSKCAFSKLKIGDFFFDESTDSYYKKINYDKVITAFNQKIGLTNTENISISIVSSGQITRKDYNVLYYNGNPLIDLKINSWNIIWFNPTFSSFEYKSFDTSRNWSIESQNLIKYINTIPNNSFVITVNSNDVKRAIDLYSTNPEAPKTISNIFEDVDGSNDALNSIGINENLLDNLKIHDSFIVVCYKNKNILHFKKISTVDKDKDYNPRDNYSDKILTYTYDYNQATKQFVIGYSKSFNLDQLVLPINEKELNAKYLYNLKENDKRVLNSYGIYDF